MVNPATPLQSVRMSTWARCSFAPATSSWLGLTLGFVADLHGPRAMLFAEAGIGVLGVVVFGLATLAVRRSKLPA